MLLPKQPPCPKTTPVYTQQHPTPSIPTVFLTVWDDLQISTPWRYSLATSGTFARCHGSVVDQAPTWPEINTRYSQTHATRCISTRLLLVWVRLADLDPMEIPARDVWHVWKASWWCGGPSTNLARKQHAIVPITRHKRHLHSSFARVGATCISRPHGDTRS